MTAGEPIVLKNNNDRGWGKVLQRSHNKSIMRDVYRKMHVQTDDLKGDFNASTLMKKLKSNKDKAEFALQLCDRLETEVTFDVPDYIKDAILFIAPSE